MYNSDLAAENYQPAYDSYDWSSEDLTPADLREEPEFARYFDRWVKYWPRKPYNVKHRYDGGFLMVKTGKGNPAALNGDWLLSCVERHLNNHRWAEQNTEKRKAQAIAALVAEGHDEESAARWVSHETWAGYYPVVDRPYWLGLWPARMITDHCIDFDAKKYLLAHYRLRGVVEPVVCPDLDHFRALKRLYDHFPVRIWCISSLTLGVHAWASHGLRERQVVHRRVKRQLEAIGLGSVEVHPMQGRCLRRPFGRDYVTITPEGEVAPWQWQVDYYEDDGRTAPFDRIVEAMIRRVERSVDRYYRADEALGKSASLSPVRPRLDAVRSWRDSGFKDRVLVPAVCSTPGSAEEPGGPPEGDGGAPESAGASALDSMSPEAGGDWPVSAVVSDAPALPGGRDPSPSFVPDLRSRKWPSWVEAMARTGLIADDTVGAVVFELAKWLYWVELHHLHAEERLGRVRVLLGRYVLDKHNGYITRMLIGQTGLVLAQVNSAVASASRIERRNRWDSSPGCVSDVNGGTIDASSSSPRSWRGPARTTPWSPLPPPPLRQLYCFPLRTTRSPANWRRPSPGLPKMRRCDGGGECIRSCDSPAASSTSSGTTRGLHASTLRP